MGADYIEPDLVSTKDGVLVARHENEIGGTTDVADHPEFADRKATKTIDGARDDRLVHRGLHARRAQDAARQGAPAAGAARKHALRRPVRDPDVRRGASTCADSSTSCDGRPVGVYPETKHPTYFRLHRAAARGAAARAAQRQRAGRTAGAPVFIQSFETGNLRQLAPLDPPAAGPAGRLLAGRPYDLVAAGDPRTYRDLVTSRASRRSPATPTASGSART